MEVAGGNLAGCAVRVARPKRARPGLGVLPGSLGQLEHRCRQEQHHHPVPGVTVFSCCSHLNISLWALALPVWRVQQSSPG